jgi:cyclopropane fatty-acyl-phospholipid synthase-like methyltransferase
LKKQQNTPSNSHKVQAFYNETTDKFLEVYGEIIQAFRTNNVEHYLDYTYQSAQLDKATKVIDAGCGVCGPAVYFAKKNIALKIDACTVSDVQVEKAKAKITDNNLNNQINVHLADYHFLENIFEKETYDCVYFLESFGHSSDKNKVIDAVWEVLKPGGKIYIKDLFRRESEDEWEQLRIDQICDDINKAYEYHIADLNKVLSKLRAKGFVLKFVKTPEVETSEFENLTISNDFQNLFNIGKIDSWADYIFPIDFYEILAEKPKQSNLEDMHLYFMNKK